MRCTSVCLFAGLAGVAGGTLSAQAMHVATNDFSVRQAVRSTSAAGLEKRVTLRVTQQPLREVLREVTRQTGVEFQYADAVIPAQTRVTVRVEDMPARQAVTLMLRDAGLSIGTVVGDHAAIVPAAQRAAKQGIIVGKITNSKTKQPISGARVYLVNDEKGTSTNADGTFRLAVPSGEHTVNVRSVGFTRGTVRVTVPDGETVTVDVALDPSASVLDEVIVTGTVVATERKAIPTPITVITAADIEQRGITRLDQLFRGEVPGVVALERGADGFSDDLGGMAASDVYVRGATALGTIASSTPSPNPLKTFVDGVELQDANYLGTVDPQSIERIEIIVGPQAATIYGSGAMGGVMQIFTKKGSGATTPDMSLSLKYGALESNMGSGRAPKHDDRFTLNGGSGPAFSYSGNLSYSYTGQWRPELWARSYGAQLGARHTAGPFVVDGSVSITAGKNGTYYYIPMLQYLSSIGEITVGPQQQRNAQTSTSSSQILSLNVEYRPFPAWQNRITVGRSQNVFASDPVAPRYGTSDDSLFIHRESNGARLTLNYNTTVLPPRLGILSQTLTLGMNGSSNEYVSTQGCTATSTATALIGCSRTFNAVGVTKVPTESYGGFLSYQAGFFDQLFFTFGLRGERNAYYGRDHRIDWTPRVGGTYTHTQGDLTVKLLTSYGRATRPPAADQRLGSTRFFAAYQPTQWEDRYPNPDLTPEYSRGPQGGIEVYYGNIGSFTLNHYRQDVTDLIQLVPVDSLLLTQTGGTFTYWQDIFKYINSASIRQMGWEFTASANAGPLTFKGAYSWSDSRVRSVNPEAQGASSFFPGMIFGGVPPRNANLSVGYARGNTNVSFVTNISGRMLYASGNTLLYQTSNNSRYRMYHPRLASNQYMIPREGYLKTDLAASHRVAPWASVTLNVFNLGNSFAGASYDLAPLLGRQTLLGVQLRYPTR